MKTTKMSLANIQGKMSRAEMKKIMAGTGGGGGCKQKYEYDCSTTSPCCAGLTCENNATNTGKICM